MSYSKKEKSGVYCIVCHATDKIYIGSSKCIESRIRTHIRLLATGKHPNKAMQKDYNLYSETFTWSILQLSENFQIVEKWWISSSRADLAEIGYNTYLGPK